MGNRQSVIFKVTMAVLAKSIDAKDDLRAFVWDFGQDNNQVNISEGPLSEGLTARGLTARGLTARGLTAKGLTARGNFFK
jgi:hypothetical protein